MIFQVIWFILWAVLWAVYFMAVVFVPVVIAYQLWIYRIFGRTKTALREEKKSGQSGLA